MAKTRWKPGRPDSQRVVDVAKRAWRPEGKIDGQPVRALRGLPNERKQDGPSETGAATSIKHNGPLLARLPYLGQFSGLEPTVFWW